MPDEEAMAVVVRRVEVVQVHELAVPQSALAANDAGTSWSKCRARFRPLGRALARQFGYEAFPTGAVFNWAPCCARQTRPWLPVRSARWSLEAERSGNDAMGRRKDATVALFLPTLLAPTSTLPSCSQQPMVPVLV